MSYNGDRIFAFSYHHGMVDKLKITKAEIAKYLREVKLAVRQNRYTISKNRQKNNDLFITYVLSEEKAKKILLSLKITDFSERLQNHHPGYEHEQLYVFGKDVMLLQRFGNAATLVSLYIKFNKLKNCYVIVISFHEQEYPMQYYFK